MKKQVLISAFLVAVFLIGTASTFAQFSAGARLGVDFSSYSKFSKLRSDIEDNSNGKATVKHNIHAGFQAGFTGVYSFSDNFGVEAELIFDRKGEKYTVTADVPPIGDYKGVYTIGVTYLTIPILFRGGAKIGESFKIHGIIGPYIGIALGGKSKGTSNNEAYGSDFDNSISFTQEPEKPEKNTTYMKRFDFGLTFGVIPAYKLGPGDIFLDLRYNFGFLDVQNPYEEGENYYARCNRSFGFSVGYLYTFGKK